MLPRTVSPAFFPAIVRALRLTAASRLAIILGATAAGLAGCAAKTDDVYTADEAGRLGRIARGEADYPLEVGTEVPDVDGRATELTSTMRGVRLEVAELRVEESCDSETGEFYFEIGVGHRPIAIRRADDAKSVSQGGVLPIDASRVFFAESAGSFSVYSAVSEEDDFLRFGDDEVGSKRAEHPVKDVEKAVTWHEVRLGSGSCSAWLTYGLERVQ